MNCKKCGYVLSNQDQTCPNCGEVNELYNGGLGAPSEPVAPVTPAPMPSEPVAPVTPTPMPSEPVAPVTPTPMPSEPVAPVTPAPMPSESVAPVTPAPIQTDIPSMENVNAAATSTKPKKNGLFIVTIIVLCLIILGVGTFVVIKLLNPTKEQQGNEDVTPKQTEQVVKTETVKISNIVFTIPEDVIKSTSSSKNEYKNKTNSFVFSFDGITNETTYDALKEQFLTKANDYKTNYESKEATYINASEYTNVGRNYTGVSYFYQNYYTDYFITQVNDKYIMSGSITYLASDKANAYKALNDFISSAKEDSTIVFTSTVKVDQILDSNKDVVKEIK